MQRVGGRTIGAEGSIVRSEGAVTQVSVVLLNTLPSVPAVHPEAAAMALAAWIHPWRYLCPLFQVKSQTIYLQSPYAAQEASLTTGCPWKYDISHKFLHSSCTATGSLECMHYIHANNILFILILSRLHNPLNCAHCTQR